MNEYPELSTLFNNGMGPTAALYAGQRAGQAEQAANLDNQKSQLANDQAMIMNPLNQQYRQGEIASQQAQLPGQVGLSQTQAAAGLTAQQNQELASKAKAAEYFSKMDDEQLKKISTAGQKMTAMGAALEGTPPGFRQQKLKEMMSSMGVTNNDPLFSQFLQVPEDRLSEIVTKAGTTLVQSSGEFLQKKALQTQKETAEQKKTETQGQASRDVAKIQADGRVTSAQIRADLQERSKSVEKQIVQLNSIPADQRTPEEQAELSNLLKLSLSLKAIGANSTGSEIVGGTPVTTPSGRVEKTVQDIAGGNKQPQGQSHSMQDLKKMYPGVSDEQLRKAYKTKFGKEPT